MARFHDSMKMEMPSQQAQTVIFREEKWEDGFIEFGACTGWRFLLWADYHDGFPFGAVMTDEYFDSFAEAYARMDEIYKEG